MASVASTANYSFITKTIEHSPAMVQFDLTGDYLFEASQAEALPPYPSIITRLPLIRSFLPSMLGLTCVHKCLASFREARASRGSAEHTGHQNKVCLVIFRLVGLFLRLPAVTPKPFSYAVGNPFWLRHKYETEVATLTQVAWIDRPRELTYIAFDRLVGKAYMLTCVDGGHLLCVYLRAVPIYQPAVEDDPDLECYLAAAHNVPCEYMVQVGETVEKMYLFARTFLGIVACMDKQAKIVRQSIPICKRPIRDIVMAYLGIASPALISVE